MLAGVLGAGAIALGIGTAVATIHRVLDRVDTYRRVPVPGIGEITLARDGPFTIYYEAHGVGSDRAARSGVPPIRVAVRAPDGTNLPIRRYTSSFDYHLSGRDGVAIATFDAPAPGRYRVGSAADVAPGEAQLAVGSSLTKGVVGGALIMGMLCLLLFTSAVVLIVVTAIRRYHHNHPHVPPPPYAPLPPPPYTYPPGLRPSRPQPG